MKAYCPVPRPLDARELIMEAVKKEDEINHRNDPATTIPEMEYPKSGKWENTARFAFIKQLLP